MPDIQEYVKAHKPLVYGGAAGVGLAVVFALYESRKRKGPASAAQYLVPNVLASTGGGEVITITSPQHGGAGSSTMAPPQPVGSPDVTPTAHTVDPVIAPVAAPAAITPLANAAPTMPVAQTNINAVTVPPPGFELIDYNTTAATPLPTAVSSGVTENGYQFSYGGNPDQAAIVAQSGLGMVPRQVIPYSLVGNALTTDIAFNKPIMAEALWNQLLGEGATPEAIGAGLEQYVNTYSGQSGYAPVTQQQATDFLNAHGVTA